MIPISVLSSLILFIVVTIVIDVRTRRIPNYLSGSAAIAGLILNVFYFGYAGMVHSLAGSLLATALLLAPFALGGIGGGDVKMMAAVGALLGPRLTIHALAFGLVLGGVLMIVHLQRRGRLGEKLRSTVDMLVAAVRASSARPLILSANEVTSVSLPYSLPLGLGTIVALLSGGVLVTLR